MTRFSYVPEAARKPQIGLIALQSDETVELDLHRLIPDEAELLVSRVPSGEEVSSESLQAMAGNLTGAAALFPRAARFAAVGYGCTSGTAQIGAARIAALVKEGTHTQAVSDPATALVAACGALGVTRLALLSPYVAEVSARLRGVLEAAGLQIAGFGSFEEAEEARVVRISAASISDAAQALMAGSDAEALFLSCTNLRTLDVIDGLEQATGRPVLSSNQVLAWHLLKSAGVAPGGFRPGRLWTV